MSVRTNPHHVVSRAAASPRSTKLKPMKTNNSNENDASLRALLREWKPRASLPPRFQQRVWQRIEQAETATAPFVSLATVFRNWIANMLPQPALATAYVTVLIVIGASAGWSQARQQTARISGDLSMRYVQTVDPTIQVHEP
jgi:hypothetical protein